MLEIAENIDQILKDAKYDRATIKSLNITCLEDRSWIYIEFKNGASATYSKQYKNSTVHTWQYLDKKTRDMWAKDDSGY